MIYFIQASSGGPIKIGTTIRLTDRLKQLAKEAGEGLRVLAVVDGSFPEESSLHDRFSHLRAFGEWFEPGDDLLGFIVESGREWDGTDEVPYKHVLVRIDRSLMIKVRFLAASRGVSVPDLLSDMLRDPINRDFSQTVRDLEGQ